MSTMPTSRSIAAALGLAAWLGACSSPPEVRLHSLLSGMPAAPAARTPGAPMRVSVAPVGVPAAVDQPQWLVRRADDSLQILEQDRWASPPGEEVRAALRDGLVTRWGAVDAGIAPRDDAPAGASAWRVVVEVLRLDSRPGRDTALEARWTVLPPQRGATPARCTLRVREPVSADGIPPLVDAHRRAVARLADDIGRQLRAMEGGAPAACVAPPVS